jgi:NAD(P)-dependent dehydrogenase (short-subunit alcohol dehydrogenase family)
LRPLTRSIAYSNGKAATLSFTAWLAVHMAREYSPAIRVNAVAPGFILTAQNRFLLQDQAGTPSQRGRRILEAVPMQRLGRPEEIAGAALYLVSEQARFVTGAVLAVDGGFTANSGV